MRLWRPSCPPKAALNPQLRVTCKGDSQMGVGPCVLAGDSASPAPVVSGGSWALNLGRKELQIWKSPGYGVGSGGAGGGVDP